MGDRNTDFEMASMVRDTDFEMASMAREAIHHLASLGPNVGQDINRVFKNAFAFHFATEANHGD